MKPRAGDFVVAATIILLAMAIWLFPMRNKDKGEYVNIYQNGKLLERMSLDKGESKELGGVCINVKNGEAFVSEADCPDKVCEKSGKISRSGESIACVPNKILIKIEGKGEVDVIAG